MGLPGAPGAFLNERPQNLDRFLYFIVPGAGITEADTIPELTACGKELARRNGYLAPKRLLIEAVGIQLPGQFNPKHESALGARDLRIGRKPRHDPLQVTQTLGMQGFP